MITNQEWSFFIVGGLLAYIFFMAGVAVGLFFYYYKKYQDSKEVRS